MPTPTASLARPFSVGRPDNTLAKVERLDPFGRV